MRVRSPRDAMVQDTLSELLAVQAAEPEAREVLAELTMREYAELVPEPGVGPLRFGDFPFQVEWYGEEVAAAEEVIFAKSAQVGASAYGLRWALRQADVFGDTGLLVMPTDAHVHEFGDERIEPAIEGSEWLRSRILGKFVRSKRLKRVGRGFLHLRGSNSKAGAQSIAAQFIVLDELDLLDRGNLVHIERRISGARQIGKRPRIRRLGYPLAPNDGIDAAWASSDQRVWHVTCEKCGAEQPVGWEDNFRWTVPGRLDEHGFERVMRPGRDEFDDPKVVGDVWRECASCEASLEGAPIRSGRWIAQNAGSAIIGFHVWRGMVPTTDLRALVVNSRATSEAAREAFAVLDLGRPYVPASAGLTLAQLLAACQLGAPEAGDGFGRGPVTMGVDVAGERDLTVRVSEQLPPETPGVANPRRALFIGNVGSFDDVARLIERFAPVMIAVDGQPERRLARALRVALPGRVVLVEYASGHNADPMAIKYDELGLPLMARVHRTDALDAVVDSIKTGRNRPLADPPPGWLEQMRGARRRTRLDHRGRPVHVWERVGSAGDDALHAEAYDIVAAEVWRAQRAAAAHLGAQAQPVELSEHLGFERVPLSHDRHQG